VVAAAPDAPWEVRLNHHTRAVVESDVGPGEEPCPDKRKGAVMRRRIEATEARLST